MRRRLAIVLAATTSLVVVSLLIPLALAVRTIPRDRALGRARMVSLSVAQAIAVVRDRERLDELVQQTADLNEGSVSVRMPDGAILGSPFSVDPTTTAAIDGTALEIERPDGVQLLTPAVNASGNSVVGVFVPHAVMERGVYGAWLVLGGLGLVMVAIAVGIADRLARSIVIPISALADTTTSLALGDLEARVIPAGPPEVRHVGYTINQLAERISDLLTSEREAIADLSHRLRTPITVLRLDAESLTDRSEAARLTGDVDDLTSAVDALIRRARQPMSGTGVCDMRAVVTSRVTFWRALGDEQGRKCTWNPPTANVLVPVPSDELAAIVDVLIDNVFTHTPEGSPFTVQVDTDEQWSRLSVHDAGSGFDGGHIERGSSSAGSTGLGLSIATKTADAVGGGLEINRSALGGAVVTLQLPKVSLGARDRRGGFRLEKDS